MWSCSQVAPLGHSHFDLDHLATVANSCAKIGITDYHDDRSSEHNATQPAFVDHDDNGTTDDIHDAHRGTGPVTNVRRCRQLLTAAITILLCAGALGLATIGTSSASGPAPI